MPLIISPMFSAAVRLHHCWRLVGATLQPPACLAEHALRFPDPRCRAEVDLQLAALVRTGWAISWLSAVSRMKNVTWPSSPRVNPSPSTMIEFQIDVRARPTAGSPKNPDQWGVRYCAGTARALIRADLPRAWPPASTWTPA